MTAEYTMTKTEATNVFIIMLSILGVLLFAFTQQAIAQNNFCTENGYSAMANINWVDACVKVEGKEIQYRSTGCTGFMRTDCYFTTEEKTYFIADDFSDWELPKGLNTSKPLN